MQRFSLMFALTAFVSVMAMSTLTFADEEKKEQNKGGQVVLQMGDEKKDEKKDKGGHVIFGDEKKDEKKGMGGK